MVPTLFLAHIHADQWKGFTWWNCIRKALEYGFGSVIISEGRLFLLNCISSSNSMFRKRNNYFNCNQYIHPRAWQSFSSEQPFPFLGHLAVQVVEYSESIFLCQGMQGFWGYKSRPGEYVSWCYMCGLVSILKVHVWMGKCREDACLVE